jgi:hypothetical protein
MDDNTALVLVALGYLVFLGFLIWSVTKGD